MNTSTQFLYNLSHLTEYSTSFLQVMIFLIMGVVWLLFLHFFFHYVAGIFLIHRDKSAIEEKKQVLNDLILMKDIQTELEREIEQAALKATFR